ncbi:MAG: energy-coupling factor transporter transmembrane protein EcfT [Magnetococcus sp. MYC-9]
MEKCDPRAKLIALFLFMPLFFAQPMVSWGWGAAALMLLLLVQAGLTQLLHALLRQLWCLRWLFVTLLLLHALLTPGEPIWHGWEMLTWEGVREGVQQTIRLVVLICLSWMLVRTTTPMQWVMGLYRLFGRLERLGLPIRPWCAIVAFALGAIPHLVQEAGHVGAELALRLPHVAARRWFVRVQRTALGGEALLFRLLYMARGQEESLSARGLGEGLPFPVVQSSPLGWRDVLVLSLPVVIFVGARIPDWLN